MHMFEYIDTVPYIYVWIDWRHGNVRTEKKILMRYAVNERRSALEKNPFKMESFLCGYFIFSVVVYVNSASFPIMF